jgi:hypothetical protein
MTAGLMGTDRGQPIYEIRVRGTMYLWGSAGIQKDLSFSKPLILHVRNEIHGEAVSLELRTAKGGATPLGSLGAGEVVSLQIQSISGVAATCAAETTISCVIDRSI